jgi:hypothetical protein
MQALVLRTNARRKKAGRAGVGAGVRRVVALAHPGRMRLVVGEGGWARNSWWWKRRRGGTTGLVAGAVGCFAEGG